MPSRNWSDDAELIGDLREALRPTPVEQKVIDAAWAAFAWGRADPDIELAELLYDSFLDEAAPVRGPLASAPRALVFGRGPLRVELELSEGGIEGQLVPPEPGTVRLVTLAGAAAETAADAVGCFSFHTQARKPFRLSCTSAAGHLDTEWITS
jgi:hypothetical protein